MTLTPSAIKNSTQPSVTINSAVLETVGTCRFAPVNDPTHASAFSYRVKFSKKINSSSFTAADVTNTGTGGATSLSWTISNCGDDRNFKLTASSVIGDGTIIPVINLNSVQDTKGNFNLASSSTNNSIEYSAPTGWVQEAYIKAANSDAGDQFGYATSLSGDVLVVGARLEDSNQLIITNGAGASTDNSSTDSGAVYVYRRTGTQWVQEAYLKASNGDSADNFGFGVSVSGETIAVSSELEDSNQVTITNGTGASTDNSSTNSGAVYIYRRNGGLWEQEAYIKAANSNSDDRFSRIFLSGDTLIVGAPREDSNQATITNGPGVSIDNSSSNSGAVYVYKRSGTTWIQEAYIKASNNDVDDQFGSGISLSGDTLAVNSIQEDSNQMFITNGSGASSDNSNPDSGAVYVYRRIGAIWAQEAFIKASNSNAGDNFGQRVWLSGDTLAVGAALEDSNQTTITNGPGASADDSSLSSGAVYVYRRTGVTWE